MLLAGSGYTLTAGAGTGTIPLSSSRGSIAEEPGDPQVADSFFDILFELSGAMPALYNQVPLRIEAPIGCVTPDVTYVHSMGCTPLYTSPVPGQGTHVANLIAADLDLFPPPIAIGEFDLPSGGQPQLLSTSPNPAARRLAFSFHLPESSPVRLLVYDVTGRLVRVVTARTLPAGAHSVSWDLRDQSGRKVPRGVYQYALAAGAEVLRGKLVVIE
jgi:hypothetical protein